MRSSARWTCPTAADPRPCRLGLSLLELLVAIAIVAGLAAVVLPWTWSRFSRATLPETAERISATLLLARAEAMRSGRLVEVRFEPRGETSSFDPDDFGDEADRLRVRYFDPDDFEADALASLDEGFDAPRREFGDDADASSPDRADDDRTDAISGSWTVLTLPEDLRLRPRIGGDREEFTASDVASTSMSELDGAFAELEEDAEGPIDDPESVAQPMAIFLPDGSNVLSGSWWLEERAPDDGLPPPEFDRRRRIRLDLTDAAGMPRRGDIERVVPSTAGVAP
jgi:prepilin-type N-terminal cleavage/methylation domain-containing protein